MIRTENVFMVIFIEKHSTNIENHENVYDDYSDKNKDTIEI